MGKRSKAPVTDKDAEKLTLKEHNGRIRFAEYRATKMKLSISLNNSTAFQRQNAAAFD
jgi:hypothetical protein